MLPVKLRRGSARLEGDIVNASASGCLLVLSLPLEAGEVLEASVPELMLSDTKLYVLRCHASPQGYTVAVSFEAPVAGPPSRLDG